jgi:predicted nucleic acid-binding protein
VRLEASRLGVAGDMKLIVDSCVFIDAFDPLSPNHPAAVQLLAELRARSLLVTMPAHGWFEVQCAFQRLYSEQRFVGPCIAGKMDYPIELIHIDNLFIEKYAMADIPYIKAGDHIFVAIAKINGWPLVTSDAKMIAISEQCGVRVFEPAQLMNELGENT